MDITFEFPKMNHQLLNQSKLNQSIKGDTEPEQLICSSHTLFGDTKDLTWVAVYTYIFS